MSGWSPPPGGSGQGEGYGPPVPPPSGYGPPGAPTAPGVPGQPGAGTPPYDAAPHYGPPGPYGPVTPPRRSRARLWLAIGGGALVVVIVVAVAVVLIARNGIGPAHAISAPEVAGGLQRDHATEGGLSQLEGQKQTLRDMAKGHIKTLVSAVYREPGALRASGGWLFLGATADSFDRDRFLEGVTNSLKLRGATVTEVDAGSLGGKAVCGDLKLVSVCVWADNDTFGEVIPLAPGRTVTDVAETMRKMRADIEKPA